MKEEEEKEYEKKIREYYNNRDRTQVNPIALKLKSRIFIPVGKEDYVNSMRDDFDLLEETLKYAKETKDSYLYFSLCDNYIFVRNSYKLLYYFYVDKCPEDFKDSRGYPIEGYKQKYLEYIDSLIKHLVKDKSIYYTLDIMPGNFNVGFAFVKDIEYII